MTSSNVHLFARDGDATLEEARLRQEAVDAAHRALTHGTDGIRNFPIFLAEIFERRAWEKERLFSGGTRQEPITFSAFVHTPYPVGLGSTFDAIERLIRSDVKLLAIWTEVTKRPIGANQHSKGVNIVNTQTRPMGNSAAQGLRRLQKAAEDGNEVAAHELALATTVDERGKPAKSVHAACVDAGLRKPTKIDRDVKQRCDRANAEIIVEHVPHAKLDSLVVDLFSAGHKSLAIEIKNLVGESIMDRRYA